MLQVTGIDLPKGLRPEFGDANNALRVGPLVSRLIVFAIIIAGFYFLVRLLSAGYSYLTSGGDSGKMQNAAKEISNGVVGLLIVLSAFFIAQILEVIFGLKILNTP